MKSPSKHASVHDGGNLMCTYVRLSYFPVSVGFRDFVITELNTK